MTTKTFREAYGVLQRHAETLRNQREPNIDDLLNIVTESVSAYQVCKERIDAVEKALEQALGSVGVEPAGSAARGDGEFQVPTPKSATGFDDMDDDVPF